MSQSYSPKSQGFAQKPRNAIWFQLLLAIFSADLQPLKQQKT